ncbi:thioredoxin-like protein [Stipitochalara longipes BDJ]|nr:thioredoxin-like protein [Stipitochalara longipes BDJ]
MTLKIHGFPCAISTQRVINICHELGLDYTFILVNFKAPAQTSPEYLALQPFGKVPLLEDDGFLVHESRAICKYLAVKYSGQGNRLIPDQTEVDKYAVFEQVNLQENNYLQTAATLETILAAYEMILSKQKYLSGNDLTLVDLYHLPYGTLIKTLGFAKMFARFSHVNAWFDELSRRQSWIKTVQ